jgi:2-C-methyl-D-erythritol 2,4-cyclodiphosphate synthase
MIVLASLWAKLHPPRSGTFASELIAYGPFVLIALLAAFVWWYDGKHKQRAQLEETQPYAKRLSVHCGIGYDLHRLAEGRKLIIGGIEVPFEKGPVGHSDGDVVAHALCDALLGAAGLGDMGTHFPDSDPQWKGANSLLFLEHARKLLDEKHFAIEYVDAVVILERPKLGPHFPKMREALAKSLRVPVEKIHLKAKTNEGVDAVGRGEAIAAHVIATISTP